MSDHTMPGRGRLSVRRAAAVALVMLAGRVVSGSVFLSTGPPMASLSDLRELQHPLPSALNADDELWQAARRQLARWRPDRSKSMSEALMRDAVAVLGRELGPLRTRSGSDAGHAGARGTLLVVCGGMGACDMSAVLQSWLGPGTRVVSVVSGAAGPGGSAAGSEDGVLAGSVSSASFWRSTVFAGGLGRVEGVVVDRGSGLTRLEEVIALRESLPRVAAGGALITVGSVDTGPASQEASLVHGSVRTRELETRCGSLSRAGVGASGTPAGELGVEAVGVGLGAWDTATPPYSLWPGLGNVRPDAAELASAGRGRLGDLELSRSERAGTLGVWGIREELESLVHELYGWWGFFGLVPRSAEQMQWWNGVDPSRLEASRRVRQSVLGERWRSWFMRGVESLGFGKSWAVVRRTAMSGLRRYPQDARGGLVVESVGDLTVKGDSRFVASRLVLSWMQELASAGLVPPLVENVA